MDFFLCVSLQMELHAKFLCESSIRTSKIRDLTINTRYPILGAERAVTHLGRTVILTVLEGTNTVLKVFLPKRYARVVSNTDIAHINMHPGFHYLIYQGFDDLSRYSLQMGHE